MKCTNGNGYVDSIPIYVFSPTSIENSIYTINLYPAAFVHNN